MEKVIDTTAYNRFCRSIKEGNVLYNVDSTNLWGDYLLVADITAVKIGAYKTYTVLLLGLKKEENGFKPRNMRVRLTPEYAKNIPFLKYVGWCHFELRPEISKININNGLVAVYGQTNLHDFAAKLSVRKPKRRKYGKDGNLIIKPTNNK